jgi:hypothetical protein
MKHANLRWILVLLCAISLFLSGCPGPTTQTTQSTTTTYATRKPVIYLYPPAAADVRVTLDYQGLLTCTYPRYDNGWLVTAYPDGTLVNKADGQTYSYLYWEGLTAVDYDFSLGFVVKGADTAVFLQDKLAKLGLTPREYNEFIVYWLPLMQDNPYNLIAFQDEAYTDHARLDISPRPDAILRVFMAYKPLDHFVDVPEQVLTGFTRSGFTIVEWGGTCVK